LETLSDIAIKRGGEERRKNKMKLNSGTKWEDSDPQLRSQIGPGINI
jgi:hypothetical protein